MDIYSKKNTFKKRSHWKNDGLSVFNQFSLGMRTE